MAAKLSLGFTDLDGCRVSLCRWKWTTVDGAGRSYRVDF